MSVSICVKPLLNIISLFNGFVILCKLDLIEMHYSVEETINYLLFIHDSAALATARFSLVKYSKTAASFDPTYSRVALANKH